MIPGEMSFPAGIAVLDLKQRDHTATATSSSVLKAGECMET